MKNLKSLLHLIFSGKFEHTFLTLFLGLVTIVIFTPFWIGNTKITDEGWRHIAEFRGAMVVLLTLMVRSLFEKKNDITVMPSAVNIGDKQCNCGLHSTPLSPINIQPIQSTMVESRT